MGSAYKETCHASIAEAVAHVCAAEYPRFDPDGSGGQVARLCVPGAGSSVAITSFPAGAASSAGSTAVTAVSFADCNPAQHYEDLGAYFAVGLPAILAIYLVKMMFAPLAQNQ